jgi:CheY-like chemotaxis protein
VTGALNALLALLFSPQTLEAPAAVAPETPTSRRQRTILVIDDDEVYVGAVERVLIDAGYRVLTSTNGPRGLEILRYAHGNVDMVLLDYNMPKFDGVKTLEQVKKMTPRARVIAVTGVDLAQLPESFRKGVDKLIAKPFRTRDLIDTIQFFLHPHSDDPGLALA